MSKMNGFEIVKVCFEEGWNHNFVLTNETCSSENLTGDKRWNFF